jgi:hypothetical protein
MLDLPDCSNSIAPLIAAVQTSNTFIEIVALKESAASPHEGNKHPTEYPGNPPNNKTAIVGPMAI